MTYPDRNCLALPEAVQVLHCRIIELEQSGGGVFLQVFNLRSSGNREHYRRFLKQPRERDLRGLRVEALRGPRQWTVVFREFAGSEWKPGDEAEIFPSAIIQHLLGISIDQIISILDGNDRCDAPHRLDLRYVDFR